MSDVLFDTGRYSLRPLAREKLAKIAGIVSGHPGLKLDVEGHTDSVGGDDYNQKLTKQGMEGRQKNRRVEIVITGDVIGTAIGIPIASK